MSRPYEPEMLRDMIRERVEYRRKSNYSIGPRRSRIAGAMVSNLENCFGNKDPSYFRHLVTDYLVGHESTKDMDDSEIMTLHRWLNATKDEVSGEWLPDPSSAVEAIKVARAALSNKGQMEMELW